METIKDPRIDPHRIPVDAPELIPDKWEGCPSCVLSNPGNAVGFDPESLSDLDCSECLDRLSKATLSMLPPIKLPAVKPPPIKAGDATVKIAIDPWEVGRLEELLQRMVAPGSFPGISASEGEELFDTVSKLIENHRQG